MTRRMSKVVAVRGEPDGHQRDEWLRRVADGELPHTVAGEVGVTMTALRRLAQRNEAFALAREEALEAGRHAREHLVDHQVERWAVDEQAAPAIRLAWAKRWNHAYRDQHRVEMDVSGSTEVSSPDVADAIDRFTAAVVRLAARDTTAAANGAAHAGRNGRARLPVGGVDGEAGPNGAAG